VAVSARPIVVKLGGEVVGGPVGGAVAADVAALVARGERVVVVHGGGPQATTLQKALGITPNIVGGRRITDAATLDVMKMVVAGKVNVDLCGQLMAAGARPVGLHGASSGVVRGVKRPPRAWCRAAAPTRSTSAWSATSPASTRRCSACCWAPATCRCWRAWPPTPAVRR
jgi:acetylglutamate kinase